MKKVTTIYIILGLLVLGKGATAQNGQQDRDSAAIKEMQYMRSALQLSDDQVQLLTKANDSYEEAVKNMRGSHLEPTERKRQMEENTNAYRKEIKGILTAEQWTMYTEIEKKRIEDALKYLKQKQPKAQVIPVQIKNN
jgi:hypothetical protein